MFSLHLINSSKGFNNVQYGCESVFVQVKSIHHKMNPSSSKPLPPPRAVLAPPRLAAYDLVPNQDGSLRAVPRQTGRKVSVSAAAREANCSIATIYRLYNGGLLTGERPTPRKIMIDFDSLQAHLVAARDPDFWTRERRTKYLPPD